MDISIFAGTPFPTKPFGAEELTPSQILGSTRCDKSI